MKSLKGLWQRVKAIRYCLKHPGKGSSATYNKWPPNSTFNGKRVLNLGCGSSVYSAPNVINTDFIDGPGVNMVLDLSKQPFPFRDNEFDLIIANHVLEHVPGWFEAFKECARVVKVGGKIIVWGPGDGTAGQLGYRDHINTINICSWYGVKGTIRNAANNWEAAEYEKLGPVRQLRMTNGMTRLMNFWWLQALPDSLVAWCVDHLRNVVAEVGWEFTKEDK